MGVTKDAGRCGFAHINDPAAATNIHMHNAGETCNRYISKAKLPAPGGVWGGLYLRSA
jgi:hypothetical protein